MAREKGMGSLQQEKSGRWTMRVCIKGKRYSRSTRTKDKAKDERFLQRFLSPLGLGEKRLPLAANAGVPFHIVQSIVGHESTAMTRHYYHESADALKRAVAAIPDLGEGANGQDARSPMEVGVASGQDARTPMMTQGQLEELAQIYSQLKHIFEP